MHGPGEVRRRLVFVDVLGQQDRVRAQIHELLARDDAFDDLRQFLVDQRLATGNGNDRCIALVHRCQCLLDAHALLQNFLGLIDLAAAGASQIALEQWLQHHRQRITLLTAQLLAKNVASDRGLLDKRNTQRILQNVSAIDASKPEVWGRLRIISGKS
jgi:hypothetical protein